MCPITLLCSYQSVVRPESNFGTDDNQTVFFSPSNHFFYLVERVSKAAEAYPNDQSKEPIRNLWDLIDAGFDAVYHDNSYDCLKDIYQGRGQNGYDGEMIALSPAQRSWAVEYLENHDEIRC